jgi:hypothetical protein
MSKLTTRLDDRENIINIAKQRYESQQRSKLPTIIVDLASGGEIYPKSHPLHSGKIEMRYMTAYDEDILTNSSYIREGVLFDKLLEAIIVSEIDIQDIASVDRDGLIIYARILSYGAEYPVAVTDPTTNKQFKQTIDLSKIQPKPFKLFANDQGEFSYKTASGYEIKFTYLVKFADVTSVTDFLKSVITQVNESRSQADIEHFIRYDFLAAESRAFREYIVKNAPGMNFEYEFQGESGGTFTAGFSLGSDLFWF